MNNARIVQNDAGKFEVRWDDADGSEQKWAGEFEAPNDAAGKLAELQKEAAENEPAK